jgi:hypothetical protein
MGVRGRDGGKSAKQTYIRVSERMDYGDGTVGGRGGRGIWVVQDGGD